MTLTDQLSKILRDFGITVFFGIPGIHNLPFYRSFHREGHKLVTVRHEQSAAFMADGFARASGKIAGNLLIDGPGFLNAATAIAQARADSVPIVILTPCSSADSTVGKLHELPGQAIVAKEITRAHLRLGKSTTAREIAKFLEQKLYCERPGPVHIEIPLSLLNTQVDHPGEMDKYQIDQDLEVASVKFATEVLRNSKRPIIVVGGGAVHAQQELVEFAEKIDAPVVNSTNAKGLLPNGHRLKVGYSPSFPEVRTLLEEADVVIALGTELGETDFDFFLLREELSLKYVIRVDIDPMQLQANATADIPILGDTKQVLQALLQYDFGRKRDGSTSTKQTRKLVRANVHCNEDLAEFLKVIQEQTDVLVGDSSQPNYYAQLLYEPDAARGYFHSATGFGTLGYSIPATIGAKIARPNEKVACLVGDGGAAFSLSELQTASQLSLSIPFIVWNNNGYEEIDKAMRAESTERYYTSPSPPNFELIAQAFAMQYQLPKNLRELRSVLTAAYEDGSPTIIEVAEQEFLRRNLFVNWFEESE